MIQRLNGDAVSAKEAREKAVSAHTSAQKQINEQIREKRSQTGQRKPVVLLQLLFQLFRVCGRVACVYLTVSPLRPGAKYLLIF